MFMRKYGNIMSTLDKVYLKAPIGPIREVTIMHSDNGADTWLHRGWNDFKQYYSIKFGHFLVFEYRGNSYFDVLIFDGTSTEIEYPLDDIDDDDDDEEGIKIDNIESEETSRKKAKYDDLVNHHPDRKGFWKYSPPSKQEEGSSSKPTSRNMESERVGHKRVNHKPVKEEAQRTVNVDTNMAFERAKAFMANNVNPSHISFVCLIRSSHVSPSQSSNLRIPTVMTREISDKKNTDMKLCVTGTRLVWCAKCNYGIKFPRITSGWRSFLQDNGLKLDDACYIEVNKSNKLVWNVTLFKN